MEALYKLAQVQLGTGATSIYTAPAQPNNTRVRIVMWICNTDTAQRTVTIRHGTGTLTAANSLFDGTIMSPGKVYVCGSQENFSICVQAGEKLEGLADAASKITVTIYGALIQ